MKKLFILFFVLMASVNTIFAEYHPDIVRIGDLFYWLNDDNSTAEVSVTTFGDNGYYKGTTLSIPSVVTHEGKNYTVTAIGLSALSYSPNLTSVTIPNTITYIRSGAFKECTSLSSVTIPNGVITIGSLAFQGCTSLNSINLPTGISNIEDCVFQYCSNLQSITIPENVTTIGDYAFGGCSSLTSINIPSAVKNIGQGAFGGCSIDAVYISDLIAWCQIQYKVTPFDPFYPPLYNVHDLYLNGELVTDLVIPEEVTTISNYAFYSCNSLTSVIIPNGVVEVGGNAFSNCPNLASVNIPNSISEISCFANCPNLTMVTINSNTIVSQNYDSNFSNMSHLFGPQVQTYIIGDSVTSIGIGAFSYCDSLQSVIISNGVKNIGTGAFDYCFKLANVAFGENVDSIGQNAFAYCPIQSIDIPNSVTTIGDNAFYNNRNMTSVTFGDGVKNIGERAFFNNSNLTSIVIPNSVKSIGQEAFWGCQNLKDVVIGNGLSSIEYGTFYECDSLRSITISSSITNIESGAFYFCDKLNEIHYTGSIEDWCSKSWMPSFISTDYALYIEGQKVTDLIIPDEVARIGYYAFRCCMSLTTLNIPNTYIGTGAFNQCKKLKTVNIGNGVLGIGNDAFGTCLNLSKVTIGNSVTSIGTLAFSYCTSLDTIYNNAETPQPIEDNVFGGINKSNCRLIVPPGSLELYKAADVWKEFLIEEKLCIADYGMCGEYVGWTVNCDSTELWIEGSGVMSDGAPWAEYYGSIRKIILDKGVTRIGAGAFAGASIAKITIPGKVNSIGAGAFSGCSSLSSIVCEAVTPPVCDANVFAGVNKSIPLVIPERSREAYKAADQWRDFFPARDSQEIIGPDTIPTVEEVTQLYPLTGNNLIVCLYFDVAPCNDVYFPGNYRLNASGGWSTDINELERFEPLPRFPGWYVVEVPYMDNAQGKPVQLRSDDIFDWEYQSGDANAWINHGTLEATVVSGYPGEADIYYPVPGCYIYELVYWKNHKSPCTVVPKHDYTIQLYAPDACEEMKPAVVGSFNNWSIFVPMTETTDLQGRKEYTFTIYDEEGHLFRFADSEYGWSNQLQYYDLEYGYWQNFDNYILPETDQDTTLVFDYSDNGKYRFATCENNVPTIPSGINNAISEKDEPRKLLRDGQLLILRGEKVYTLQGVEVK